MKHLFLATLIAVLFSFQAFASKTKPQAATPEYFKELIHSFLNAGWNLKESEGLVPLKRFIRGGEPAALEGLADQRLLGGMSPGLAAMMISSLEALERFRNEIRADRLRGATTIKYRHLREGIDKSREAIMSRKHKHIFNAVIEMNGVFSMVPHLQWSKKEKTYIPTVVKGHKKVAGSPLNNDVLELATIARLLTNYKLPMPSVGEIRLLPQDSNGTRIPVRVQNYVHDVDATIKALTELVAEYKTEGLEERLEKSEHRTGATGVSKARALILDNLTRQLDLSMVPNPPSPEEKERLAELGYKDLRSLAKINPSDLLKFNELASSAGIQPKRLFHFVARARAFSAPPFNRMSVKEWHFFHQLGITSFAEFMNVDPKVSVEKVYDSSTFNFTEKGQLGRPNPATTKAEIVQKKRAQKEDLIRMYADFMQVTVDQARRKINRFMREARANPPFVLTDSYSFPHVKKKWLLDLENIGSRTYLIGLNEGMDHTGKSYRNFVGINGNKPWNQFIQHFEKERRSGQVPTIFHVSQHEITLLMKYLSAEKEETRLLETMSEERRTEMTEKGLHFKYTDQHSREWIVRVHDRKLMKKYGATTLSTLFGSFHDLLPYLRRHLAGPSHSNSMKFVLLHLVKMGRSSVAWADAEASGLESIAWFQDYEKTKDFRFLDRVLRYCMIDVLGMIPMVQVIEEMSRQKPHPELAIDEKYKTTKRSEIERTGERPEKFWSFVGERIRKHSRVEGLVESMYNYERILNPSRISSKDVLNMALIFDLSEMYRELRVLGQQRGTRINDEDLQKEALRVRTFDQIRHKFIEFLKNASFPVTNTTGPYFYELMLERYKLRPARLIRLHILHMLARHGVPAQASFDALSEALTEIKSDRTAEEVKTIEAALKTVKSSLGSLDKILSGIELKPYESTARQSVGKPAQVLTPAQKKKVLSCLRAS